jgi:extradiol dioxygenase family protein
LPPAGARLLVIAQTEKDKLAGEKILKEVVIMDNFVKSSGMFHVGFGVRDLKKSVKFYMETLSNLHHGKGQKLIKACSAALGNKYALALYYEEQGIEVVQRPTTVAVDEEENMENWFMYARDPDGNFVETVGFNQMKGVGQ